MWNNLGFSLCVTPSICHVVITSDVGKKSEIGVSANWYVAVEHWEIEFNKRLSSSIIRLANYNVTTSLIYKLIV